MKEKNPKLKLIKVLKFMSKTKLSHFVLSITFDDKFEDHVLIFYS